MRRKTYTEEEINEMVKKYFESLHRRRHCAEITERRVDSFILYEGMHGAWMWNG